MKKIVFLIPLLFWSCGTEDEATPLLMLPSESETVEETENLDEVLFLTSSTYETSFDMEIDTNRYLAFFVENYNDTNLSLSFQNIVSIPIPTCQTISSTKRLCSTKITALSSGTTTLSISVLGKSVTPLEFEITVLEAVVEEEEVVVEVPKLNEVLSFQSGQFLNIEVGETDYISFKVANFSSSTSLSVQHQTGNILETSSPICPTQLYTGEQLCSFEVTGSRVGTETIYIKTAVSTISTTVTVVEPPEPDEVLSLISEIPFELEIDETKDLSFRVENIVDDTEFSLSLQTGGIVALLKPTCVDEVCTTQIKGISAGTEQISIGVVGKDTEPLEVEISVLEAHIFDSNESLEQSGDMSLSISTETQTSENFNTVEGEEFFVVSTLNYPERYNSKVEVLIRGDKLEIVSHTQDGDNRTDRYIFRTKFKGLSSGVEVVTFRIVGTSISNNLTVYLDTSMCGLNSSDYEICSSDDSRTPCENGAVYLLAKMGFEDVTLFYRKGTYRSLDNQQNLIHLSNSSDAISFSETTSSTSFGMLKISEDLEFEDFTVKYQKIGEQFQCLSGIFPERYLVEIEEAVEIDTDDAPPEAPPE
jgi:hypothetical protein